MGSKTSPTINKIVAIISVCTGILAWYGCHYIYITYHDVLYGPVMIGIVCAILFSAVFFTVSIGSLVTGSFDEDSILYEGPGSRVKYFLLSLIGVFALAMGLEFLYECNPIVLTIQPTSYIFVIDESGSMSGNDPAGIRYEAIPEIMEAEKQGFPYMVYTFSDSARIARDMGPLDSEYEALPTVSDGGTAILGTLHQIVQDYKDGLWDGGANPKVVFLTDGSATDISRGFLWLDGNMAEFSAVLDEYYNSGVTISAVGLGNVDREIMTMMAETTGGIFINIDDASDLTSAMKTAAISYSERDLLSIRYMRRWDWLYGVLRVLFLSIIGTVIGSLILLAYMEDSSIRIIVFSSVLCSLMGSILFEIGLKTGVFQSTMWGILWFLFSLTLGYYYPREKVTGNEFPVRLSESCRYSRKVRI